MGLKSLQYAFHTVCLTNPHNLKRNVCPLFFFFFGCPASQPLPSSGEHSTLGVLVEGRVFSHYTGCKCQVLALSGYGHTA